MKKIRKYIKAFTFIVGETNKRWYGSKGYQQKQIIATVLIIGLLVSGFSLYGQIIRTDLKSSKLNGKVKSVDVTNYLPEEINGKITKGKKIGTNYVLYNEKGNRIEYGGENFKDTYTYDSNGYLSEWNLSGSDAGPFNKFVFKHDNRGNQIESEQYNTEGSMLLKNTFQYNSEGYLIEWNNMNPDGSLIQRVTYKNDQKGNQVESDYYDQDGSLSSKNTFKYDTRGNQLESNSYNATGSFLYKYSYKYDDKGNAIELRLYKPDGSYSKDKWEYEFDAHNNIISSVFSKNDKPKKISEIRIEYY